MLLYYYRKKLFDSKEKPNFYELNKGNLSEQPESADASDQGMIAAFGVLRDFKGALLYPVDNELIKSRFYFESETFEVIYIAPGQEEFMNQAFDKIPAGNANRLIIIESKRQAMDIRIDRTFAFCLVDENGAVSYYSKKNLYGKKGNMYKIKKRIS